MLDTLGLWQALCLMGLALQHADQSLYGFLFLTSDSLRANILICKWIGQQCSKNPYASSSFPSNQYVAFLSQPSMQFCKLVSKWDFPRKKLFGLALSVSRFSFIYIYSIDPPTGKRHVVWRRL